MSTRRGQPRKPSEGEMSEPTFSGKSKRILKIFKKKRGRQSSMPSSDLSTSSLGARHTKNSRASYADTFGSSSLRGNNDTTSESGLSFRSETQSTGGNTMTRRLKPHSELVVDLYGDDTIDNDPYSNHLIFNRGDAKRHLVKRSRSSLQNFSLSDGWGAAGYEQHTNNPIYESSDKLITPTTKVINSDLHGVARVKSIGGQSLSTKPDDFPKRAITQPKAISTSPDTMKRSDAVEGRNNISQNMSQLSNNSKSVGKLIMTEVAKPEVGLTPDSGFSSPIVHRADESLGFRKLPNGTTPHNTYKGINGIEYYEMNTSVNKSAEPTFGDSNGSVRLVLNSSQLTDARDGNNVAPVAVVESNQMKTVSTINFPGQVVHQRQPLTSLQGPPHLNRAAFYSGKTINECAKAVPMNVERRSSLETYQGAQPPVQVPMNNSNQHTGIIVRTLPSNSHHSPGSDGMLSSSSGQFSDKNSSQAPNQPNTLPTFTRPMQIHMPKRKHTAPPITLNVSSFERQGSIHERINKVQSAPFSVVTHDQSHSLPHKVEILKDFDVHGRSTRVDSVGPSSDTVHNTPSYVDQTRLCSPQSPHSVMNSSRSVYSSDSDMSSVSTDKQPARRLLTVQAKLPFHVANVHDARNSTDSSQTIQPTRTREVVRHTTPHMVEASKKTVPVVNEYSYVLKKRSPLPVRQTIPVRNVQRDPNMNYIKQDIKQRAEIKYVTPRDHSQDISVIRTQQMSPHNVASMPLHSIKKHQQHPRKGPHKTSILLTSDGESDSESINLPATAHWQHPANPKVVRGINEKLDPGPHKTYVYITSDTENEDNQLSKSIEKPNVSDTTAGKTTIHLNGTGAPVTETKYDKTRTTVHVTTLIEPMESKQVFPKPSTLSPDPGKVTTTHVHIAGTATHYHPMRVYSASDENSDSEPSSVGESVEAITENGPSSFRLENKKENEFQTVIHLNGPSVNRQSKSIHVKKRTVEESNTDIKRQDVEWFSDSSNASDIMIQSLPKKHPSKRDTKVHVLRYTSNADDGPGDVTKSPERPIQASQTFNKTTTINLRSPSNRNPPESKKGRKMDVKESSNRTSFRLENVVLSDDETRPTETMSDSDADENQNTEVPAPDDLQVKRKEVLISNYIDTTAPRIVDIEADENVNMFEGSYFTTHENPLYYSDEDLSVNSKDKKRASVDEVDSHLTAEDIDMFHGAFLSDRTTRHLFPGKLMRSDSTSSITSVNDLYRDAKSESYRYETGFRRAPPKSFELSELQRKRREMEREQYLSERRRLIERSVNTSIHVDHDEVTVQCAPSDDMEVLDRDNVNEHVELGIVGNKAQVRVRVIAERFVPIFRGSDTYKKSVVTVTKLTEIDMNSMPETRALFDKIHNSPGIARRMVNNKTAVSHNEQTLDGRDVYRIYNALTRLQEEAEELKKTRPTKVVVSGTMNGEIFADATLPLPKWTAISESLATSEDEDGTNSTAGDILY